MMMFPIVLINRNLLTTTKKLIEDLWNLGETNLHIIDNGSTYPPLLEWYNNQTKAHIHFHENLGERAIWNSGLINKLNSEWIVISDSDIELNPNTPKSFLDDMLEIAIKYNYNKIGLSLSLDFPQENPYQIHSYNWEQQFWKKELEPNVFQADVDTTFNLFRKGAFTYESLRIAGNYTAKHTPWYKDITNLSEEDKYYLAHSSDTSTFKRFYEQINKLS